MKNIYLLGFMGSGKSEIGKRLSKSLGKNFIDMDKIIEKKEKMSIRGIFERFGEKYFRGKEKKLLEELDKERGKIISTGGGIVMDEENWKVLKNGITIYLKISFKEALKRLKKAEDRPLLLEGNREKIIGNLLKKRGPFYERADYIIPNEGKSIDEVVGEIKRIIENEKD